MDTLKTESLAKGRRRPIKAFMKIIFRAGILSFLLAISPVIMPVLASADKDTAAYNDGIKAFKAGDLTGAFGIFNKLSKQASAPVSIYSLNMSAQIKILSGDNESAVKFFDELIHKTAPLVSRSRGWFEIFKSANLACANLYQRVDDLPKAIKYYQRLLDVSRSQHISPESIAGLCDELAVLNFQIKNYDKYKSFTKLLAGSGYYRSELADFELRSFDFLQHRNCSVSDIQRPQQLPSRLVDYVRNHGIDSAEIENFKPSEIKQKSSFGSICAHYQYGCLLDASGKSARAADVFIDICASSPKGRGSELAELVKGYSSIYAAMIFSCQNQYNRAIEIVAENRKRRLADNHLALLASDVLKSLKTLKREVVDAQQH